MSRRPSSVLRFEPPDRDTALSTPPLTPKSLFCQNCSGSTRRATPRYTGWALVSLLVLTMSELIAKMVVVYRLASSLTRSNSSGVGRRRPSLLYASSIYSLTSELERPQQRKMSSRCRTKTWVCKPRNTALYLLLQQQGSDSSAHAGDVWLMVRRRTT